MSKKTTSGLSARGPLAKKKNSNIKTEFNNEEIDFSDMPKLTDEQLKKFKRRKNIPKIIKIIVDKA